MSHLYHQDLPDFVEDAALHTGCPECEHRAADLSVALSHFDSERVASLWDRAAHDYYWGSVTPDEKIHGASYGQVDSDFRQIIVDPLEREHFPLIQALQRLIERETISVPAHHDHANRMRLVPAWMGDTSPIVRSTADRFR